MNGGKGTRAPNKRPLRKERYVPHVKSNQQDQQKLMMVVRKSVTDNRTEKTPYNLAKVSTS